MLILPGSNALSVFRSNGLLTRLQNACNLVTAVSARYVHFIDHKSALSEAEQQSLGSLLTYGDAYQGTESGVQFIVIPRFGTISPWASKATDIAHNCGLQQIHRIERGICYFVELKSGLFGRAKELEPVQQTRYRLLLLRL